MTNFVSVAVPPGAATREPSARTPRPALAPVQRRIAARYGRQAA
jgi:hypothetical protein